MFYTNLTERIHFAMTVVTQYSIFNINRQLNRSLASTHNLYILISVLHNDKHMPPKCSLFRRF